MQHVLSRALPGAALLCLTLALTLTTVAPRAAEHDHHAMKAAAPAAFTEGIVKKVDIGTARVTLAHGPIENLGMDGMTMAFKVKASKQLAGLKVGDKVRFLADYVAGEIVIARIEAAK